MQARKYTLPKLALIEMFTRGLAGVIVISLLLGVVVLAAPGGANQKRPVPKKT